MSKRFHSCETAQVTDHSTKQVDRSRCSESHGQEYRPEISIQADDNDFESEERSYSSPERNSTAEQNEENPDTEERLRFSSVIEEIFKLLPSEKFPSKADASTSISRPKSSIEGDIIKDEKKSISLPQSQLIPDTFEFIQDQVKKELLTENWAIRKKDQDNLVNMRYYQAHNEKIPTSKEVPLDHDASKLNITLSGNSQIPVKNLNLYENQLRDLLRVLSHADIFSYAAYKSLQQESMDPKMLGRILEALATSINHSVSLTSFLTIEIQQARRDIAIRSASKSLSDMAKTRLRSTPFNSDTLFGGRIDEVYKENAESLRNQLVSNTITSSQPRAQTSTSSQGNKPEFKKPPSKPMNPRRPRKEQDQSMPRRPTFRGPARGGSSRGNNRRDRGTFPSRGGASSLRKH